MLRNSCRRECDLLHTELARQGRLREESMHVASARGDLVRQSCAMLQRVLVQQLVRRKHVADFRLVIVHEKY